jgi:DNA (cytosine-5)-methyltransferase 1
VGIREDVNVVYEKPSTKPYRKIDNSAKKALSKISKNVENNKKTKQSPKVIERLKYIKEGENAFNANIPKHLRLNVKGAKLSHIYRRLVANEPAYTITGSGGGGTHVYHWKEPRALTNRERARLQTFPDDFVFVGTKESVRKQIGMAVPPLGAKIIFEQILKCFNQIKDPNIGKVKVAATAI